MSADGSISQAELERIKYDTGVSQQGWAGQWYRDLMAVTGDKATNDAAALLPHLGLELRRRGAGPTRSRCC